MRVSGIRPASRDGHGCVLTHDGLMIIFGGDRHHMPFNDMFALDIVREFERQSVQFVRERSQEDLSQPTVMDAPI